MASSHNNKDIKNFMGEEGNDVSQEIKDMLSSLPRDICIVFGYIYQYQGFWYKVIHLQGLLTLQRQFKAQDNDLLLASYPKSGTTWLKAMAFAIVNRRRYCVGNYNNTIPENHPLLMDNPHDLVPYLENIYAHGQSHDPNQDLNLANTTDNGGNSTKNRLFSTHLAYMALPESVKAVDSKCKIVYVCRDPKDVLISLWHFINKIKPKDSEPTSLEMVFEMYCKGSVAYGPIWDHILGFWKESLERPEKIYFMKYEEIKKEPKIQLKKLAEFMGHPFSMEEERQGMVDELVKLCSFEKLRDANKFGKLTWIDADKSSLFRRGEIGDYVNYLTPEMIERLDKITDEKLHGSGLKV